MKNSTTFRWLLISLLALFLLVACDEETGGGEAASGDSAFTTSGAKETIKIVSGSENKELEHLIQPFVDEHKINIVIDYLGSVDIMNMLQTGEIAYDAVWPANSMWVSMGDKSRLVKHMKSTSVTPIVLGIRESKAQDLGYDDGRATVDELVEDITSGSLRFTMTSATQSNSGAAAYIGFLYALSGSPDVLTIDNLNDPAIRDKVVTLLSGVERSSGSSGWLKDLFVKSNYDAMINYEAMIISANNELVQSGKEPMHVVYLENGTSIADSPLGYVDHGEASKEEAFLAFQEYLLEDETQNEIQRTGRRTGFEGVADQNRDVFKAEWGVDIDTILSPITMPSAEVTLEALNLYQTEFRKPSLTIYVLDFSGSMYGDGDEQVKEAMDLILDQDKAKEYLLQANSKEMNHVIIFSDIIEGVYMATGQRDSLDQLNNTIQGTMAGGGTDMYRGLNEALNILQDYNVREYSPAIIVLSDGQSGESNKSNFFARYANEGQDVPIYSIMFGSAEERQLNELAERTNGRVFDGRDNLIEAFKSVRGYN